MATSFDPIVLEPRNTATWDEAYDRYHDLMTTAAEQTDPTT